MRHTALTILIALAALLLLCVAAGAAERVGFVDFTQILEKTNEGQRINQKIQAKGEELELQAKKLDLELRTMKKDLMDKRAALTEEAFNQQAEDLQKKFMESQQILQKSQMDAEQFKVQMIKEFIGRVRVVVNKVAQAEGYSLVILNMEEMVTNVSVVLYGSDAINLTNKVIRDVNAGSSSEAGK